MQDEVEELAVLDSGGLNERGRLRDGCLDACLRMIRNKHKRDYVSAVESSIIACDDGLQTCCGKGEMFGFVYGDRIGQNAWAYVLEFYDERYVSEL